ncbi:MAG: patatin [Syntrophomonadaceae bacterium]|nr:patatin [Syntrophomonadaceae bacterium]
MIKVLSLDGGGIRGIIPATVLAEIEKRTRKPVAELFDLIAGTSTGGLLALGLTKPGPGGGPEFTAADMVRLYETGGPEIFSRSCWYRIASLGFLAESKYPSEGMRKVYARYFGDARLKEALCDVLVTAYEIELRTPFFFRSRRAREMPEYDFALQDVAFAVTVAPTYFSPYKIDIEDGSRYYALIDGGVYANNPGMCLYAEACKTFPGEDILMLSLGTGQHETVFPYREAKKWGLAGWARPLLNIVFDGVSDTVDYQLRLLLPESANDGPRYYRLQPQLRQASQLDDVSPQNIKRLKMIARKLIEEHSTSLDRLCRRLLHQ